MNKNENLILSQALRIAKELNWSVIPVGGNKKPLVDWKKYQSVKASEDEIIGWCKQFPNANIGVVTGKVSGIVVVDLDPRHGGTDDQFSNLETVKVQTGGGGWHYYFKYERGIENKVGVAPGIDIRGDGGYVVVPPSVHSSGKNYEWINDPHVTPLAPLPGFVKGWLSFPQSVQKTNDQGKSVFDGVAEGKRNESAASVAGKLLARFPEAEWETTAWPLMQAWNCQNHPPLPDKELRSVFESIKKREVAERSQTSGTETPQGIQKRLLLSRELTFDEVSEKVLAYIPNCKTALRVVLAVASSGGFGNNPMIWLLLVGVPSSGKTDLVRLIKDSEATYYLDNLTQNAFISGERQTKSQKVYDLLPLLDKKCLVIKDWTSIFSLDEKMTKKILGDLVGIYDKEFEKFSSRRGKVSYASSFSQLGCITPATLNKHTNYLNMVGPRFLSYTMPSANSEERERSYSLIFSNSDRSTIENEARLYTSSYLSQLAARVVDIKEFSQVSRNYLRVAAELVACCRGIVLLQAISFKNEEGEEVKYYGVLDVQIEAPWRAVQQLYELSKYLAFVVGKNEVGVDEMEIIKEIVISSMPADRSQALRVVKECGGEITAKMLSDSFDKSIKTSRRLLEELTALGVLEKIKGSGTIATDYTIKECFRYFLLLGSAEFMSRYNSVA